MKVYCIDNKDNTTSAKGPYPVQYINLTIGKSYETDERFARDFIYWPIINDSGRKEHYPKWCFVLVDEWREKQIEKII